MGKQVAWTYIYVELEAQAEAHGTDEWRLNAITQRCITSSASEPESCAAVQQSRVQRDLTRTGKRRSFLSIMTQASVKGAWGPSSKTLPQPSGSTPESYDA